MPIVITSGDGEQAFDRKEDVKFSAPAPTPAPVVEDDESAAAPAPASSEDDAEPEEKASKKAKEEDDPFGYMDGEEEEEAGEDDDESDDDEEDEEEGEPAPKKSGFKKRIDKLTSQKRDLEARLAQLEALVRNPGGKQEPAAEPAKEAAVEEDLKEPNIDDFDDYTEFNKALFKYQMNEERKAERMRLEQEEVRRQAEAIGAKYRERETEAMKRYGAEKYRAALAKSDAPLTITMRSQILESEVGPDIAYFLAHNPEEAKRIVNLAPANQIKELTKLEMRVSNKLSSRNSASDASKAKEKVSKAPEPVKPISSKTDGKVVKDPNKMSYQEYKAWVKERDSKRK